MPDAISNTSPVLHLYRIGAVHWLGRLFGDVWVPSAVVVELGEGRRRGYDVPDPAGYEWLCRVEPRALVSEWLALDLGPGELAALSLALENPNRVVLIDDARARRIARAAGLTVWGTLKVLLEAKAQGLTERVAPLVDRLIESGMWVGDGVRRRILILAGEHAGPGGSGGQG